MALARKEAQRLNHDYIGTEHILAGLIQLKTDPVVTILGNLGLPLDKIRSGVEKRVKAGFFPVAMGQLPFTQRAKRSFELAVEESQQMGHSYLGGAHLLLGLLLEKEGVAAQVLLDLGLTTDRARAEVIKLLGIGRAAAPDRRSLRNELAEASTGTPLFVWQSLEVFDDLERVRARIGMNQENQPALSLLDANGTERAVLKLESDGSPSLELKDKDGKVLFKAP